jgi:hypothetical protein
MLSSRQEKKALARGRAANYPRVTRPKVGQAVCYCGRLGTDGTEATLRATIDALKPGKALVRWEDSPRRWVSLSNLRYPPR